jgi:2,4-dienoyl-CoA reductase-like NADH-dependent reductase (Old Yellow Enzyme family)/thioredoxin reductase
MKLQKLFEPINIGTMTLKNRIAMPAMDTNFSTRDGFVTPKLIDYYAERARGGAALIILECTSVDYPRGKVSIGQLSIGDDKCLEGLSRLADAIKKGGAQAAIQLEHGGGVVHSSVAGSPPMGPSETISPLGEPVKGMSTAEIAEIVELHAKAAARARKAGFDGIEIHGAHEHLLAQFLSPFMNQRQDQYGGALENRARLLLEVIRACRAEVGLDYPLWCRIHASEYGIEPAFDRAQAVQVSRWAEEAGADAIHVSGHGFGIDFVALCPGMPGLHLAGAYEVKKNINVPVIGVGRIYPELGEWAIREGVADIIAMGRALIADPYLPQKAAEGRLEDIVPCLSCWECLEGGIKAIVQTVIDPNSTEKGDLECAVNPGAGSEADYRFSPASTAKRVVVVGGGPAGMEAARVSSLRGHDVTLMEKEAQLGGQLIPGSAPPHKEAISLLAEYFATQLNKVGVKLELGREATLDNITSAQPDVVVWAAGTTPIMPDIPGVDSSKVVFAADVLIGRVSAGDNVVIIGGDGTGCETAGFLADQGKRVTVVDILPQLMSNEGTIVQMRLFDELARKKVELLTGITYEGSSPEGPVIRTTAGESRTLKADTYVLAAGARSNTELVPSLKAKFKDVYVIGDALEPRRIYDAISEGFETGRSI